MGKKKGAYEYLNLFRQVAGDALWSAQEIARATAKPGVGVPVIDFAAEAKQCPCCKGELVVEKSKTRLVTTLAGGTFRAREIAKRCANSRCAVSLRSEALALLVRARQRYGYDLIVKVGLARYLGGKQRVEIQTELRQQHGIRISTGSITHLCDRFLVSLEALHLKRAPALRAAMEGGYSLHLDATCESGKGGLFACIAGERNYVLWSTRIETENQVELGNAINKTVELFGQPLATVRDMGEGIGAAVAPLAKGGVVDLICHYHFLGAVGKKLFTKDYTLLREKLRKLSIRTELRVLLRSLRRDKRKASEPNVSDKNVPPSDLPALVFWCLEGDGSKEELFPFSLPHLEFAKRCLLVPEKAKRWLTELPAEREKTLRQRVENICLELANDTEIAHIVTSLTKRWESFSELRTLLRLSAADLPRGDERYRQEQSPTVVHKELKEIEQEFSEYKKKLQLSGPFQPSLDEAGYGVILDYLDTYGDKLFGHPVITSKEGEVLSVTKRTNNTSEHFFGREKQGLRRRLGKAHLARDLQQQPSQVTYVANLRHQDYVRVLCGSLENLPNAFASLSEKDLQSASPLVRDHRDSTLTRRVRELLERDSGKTKTSLPKNRTESKKRPKAQSSPSRHAEGREKREQKASKGKQEGDAIDIGQLTSEVELPFPPVGNGLSLPASDDKQDLAVVEGGHVKETIPAEPLVLPMKEAGALPKAVPDPKPVRQDSPTHSKHVLANEQGAYLPSIPPGVSGPDIAPSPTSQMREKQSSTRPSGYFRRIVSWLMPSRNPPGVSCGSQS